jgi:hypothetical protein
VSNELRGLAAALFAQCPQEQHRVLLAVLERVAADQYRRWADEVGDEHRAGILECAAREEQVAEVLEAAAPNATATAAALGERFPDLRTRYASLLDGKSLAEQFAIQSAAERAGAALLRSYAAAETDATGRAALLAAAELEEANADLLGTVA